MRLPSLFLIGITVSIAACDGGKPSPNGNESFVEARLEGEDWIATRAAATLQTISSAGENSQSDGHSLSLSAVYDISGDATEEICDGIVNDLCEDLWISVRFRSPAEGRYEIQSVELSPQVGRARAQFLYRELDNPLAVYDSVGSGGGAVWIDVFDEDEQIVEGRFRVALLKTDGRETYGDYVFSDSITFTEGTFRTEYTVWD